MIKLNEKKIIICGGGTAGHIYPAISIIEYIKKNYPGCKILFIGTRKGMENKFIPELGVDFKTVKSSGLIEKGKISNKILSYLKFLFLTVSGFFNSTAILIKFKPDIIIGMGGYVCGPVLIAAIFLNKSYCLHEQNYIPGRLNKKFCKSARYIFTSFKETGKYLNVRPGKIIFSGNPVREAIKNFKECIPDFRKWGLEGGRFTIVAFGGSLGAEKINSAVIKLWDQFRNDKKIQVLLISGQRFYNNINDRISGNSKYDDLSFIKIFPYINEMEEVYRIADLIISRSGANTIAELLVTNIPAILIPYPEAIENHQYFNADYLARNKKAILITDKDLEKNLLSKIVEDLLSNNKEKYNAMREEKFEFEKSNGEKIIAETLLGTIN